jgi:hypothetical protein
MFDAFLIDHVVFSVGLNKKRSMPVIPIENSDRYAANGVLKPRKTFMIGIDGNRHNHLDTQQASQYCDSKYILYPGKVSEAVP